MQKDGKCGKMSRAAANSATVSHLRPTTQKPKVPILMSHYRDLVFSCMFLSTAEVYKTSIPVCALATPKDRRLQILVIPQSTLPLKFVINNGK
jgi:hypothetical protein